MHNKIISLIQTGKFFKYSKKSFICVILGVIVSNVSIEGKDGEEEGFDPLTLFHATTKGKFDQGVKKKIFLKPLLLNLNISGLQFPKF